MIERDLPVAHPPPSDIGALRDDQIGGEEHVLRGGLWMKSIPFPSRQTGKPATSTAPALQNANSAKAEIQAPSVAG